MGESKREGTRAESGDRQADGRGERRGPKWNKKVKQEEVEPEDWEEVLNRKVQMLGYGFYGSTPGRVRLTCWTCLHECYRAKDGPTR